MDRNWKTALERVSIVDENFNPLFELRSRENICKIKR